MKRLVALTSTLALFGAGVLATASPAVAVARHVGLVVRFANGSVSVGCTTVGGSGLQVLERKHSVTMGAQQYSGFVLKIDGQGTSRPDNTHYWSYWHSSGRGGWTYSSSGAGSYSPRAGTVEGWSFVNGQANAPKPPSYKYSTLCAKLDPKPKPSPKPTPKSSSHAYLPPPPTTRTSSAAASAASSAASSAAAPAPPMARTSTRPSLPRSSRVAARSTHPPSRTANPTGTPTRTPTPRPTATPTAARTTSVPTAASPTLSPAASTTRDAGFPAWGTVLALAVVAGLGALAWILTRRRTG